MIEQLQFLRPVWFLAFIPLLIFIVLMLRRQHTSISWKTVCDSQLLPHVLTKSANSTSAVSLLLLFIAASLCITAAAGPVWKKLPQPVFRDQSALVIVLDLSQSMDAKDLRPSRLERARLKILDILKARKGGQTALLVYAASAFVVTPLTDDAATIANLVPSLQTSLMPAQGSNTADALHKAGELLRQAGANSGDILLICDDVSANATDAIEQLRTQNHRLSVLGIGTAEGGPVPMTNGFLQDSNGAIVIPKLNSQKLNQTATTGNGIFVSLQTNDSDINQLNEFFSTAKLNTATEGTELTADIWREEGPWLVLLALPLIALWSRKGWLLCLPLIVPLIVLLQPQPAYAIDTQHLWLSPDQKASRAFNTGDTKTAAELFQNQRWKASAFYRSGDYEQVINTLATPDSSDDFYNKANALTQTGRYQEAINAYDEALKLDPDNEDASYNRELVLKELEKQQQEQQDQQQNQQQDQQQQDQQQSEQQSEQQQSDQQQSEQQQAEQASEDQNKESDTKESKAKQDEDSKESEDETEQQAMQKSDEQDQKQSEDDLATEQWLRRVPDDPGGLLRRKFLYQYGRSQNNTNDAQPW